MNEEMMNVNEQNNVESVDNSSSWTIRDTGAVGTVALVGIILGVLGKSAYDKWGKPLNEQRKIKKAEKLRAKLALIEGTKDDSANGKEKK